jgi:L-malate glycosyltransferase
MTQKARIRVCHVASGDLWAGAEVQIAGLLEGLRDFSDLEVSAVVLNKGRLSDELIARNIPVVIYEETRLNALQIVRALCARFRSQRPDVVHTHRYKENVLAGIAAKLSSVPLGVHTVHGLQESLRGWQRTKMKAYSRMNTMVAKWTDQCIIGVSDEIAFLMSRQLPRNPVVRVHNGIDISKVRPTMSSKAKREELGIPENALVIGAVGRLVPIKGIAYLLSAVRALCQDLAEVPVRLLLVGDGPLRRELEVLAKELDIEQKCLFLGMRDDVSDLINVFDMYALPSLHEGIPMALLEAMAMGRPVVASRVGGIPEVLTDMEQGMLVPAQDISALCNALKELALSRQLRERLGRAGREHVAQSYESKATASEVRDLYWRLVTELGGQAAESRRIQKEHNGRPA